MHDHNMSLEIKSLESERQQRVNDEYIMDKIKIESTQKIRQINRCRIYLKIIFISDLADPGGRTLDRNIVYHRIPEQSKFTWPAYDIPSEADWKIWQWALRIFLTKDMVVLNTALGKWKKNSHIKYEFVSSPFKNNLYNKHEGQWYEYNPTNLPSVYESMNAQLCEEPKIKIPTQVIKSTRTYMIMNWVGRKRECKKKEITSLQNAKEQLHNTYQRILANVQFPRDDGKNTEMPK